MTAKRKSVHESERGHLPRRGALSHCSRPAVAVHQCRSAGVPVQWSWVLCAPCCIFFGQCCARWCGGHVRCVWARTLIAHHSAHLSGACSPGSSITGCARTFPEVKNMPSYAQDTRSTARRRRTCAPHAVQAQASTCRERAASTTHKHLFAITRQHVGVMGPCSVHPLIYFDFLGACSPRPSSV